MAVEITPEPKSPLMASMMHSVSVPAEIALEIPTPITVEEAAALPVSSELVNRMIRATPVPPASVGTRIDKASLLAKEVQSIRPIAVAAAAGVGV